MKGPESDEYKTLEAISEGVYKEKGSRFIAVAIPVSTLDEVKTHLERVKKEYYDARHHCYAYHIGEDPGEVRYNDDGEPSGTAGKPIFGQIQSFNLTNILIVVVRYFGGIKLGKGGLIQAYKTAARDAVENGIIINRVWTTSLKISFEYQKMNDVMRVIKEENLKITSQETSEKCVIILEIRRGQLEGIKNKLKSFEIGDSSVI
jgi:uncharacterized YigZ family protein